MIDDGGGSVVVGAVATVVGAAIAGLVQYFLPRMLEGRRAERAGLPKMLGRWSTEWYVREPDGTDKEYVVPDVVDLARIRRGEVIGKGDGQGGDYTISGRLEDHGVMVFTYRSGAQCRYELVGTFVVRRDPENKVMRGHWSGVMRGNTIAGGSMVMKKVD